MNKLYLVFVFLFHPATKTTSCVFNLVIEEGMSELCQYWITKIIFDIKVIGIRSMFFPL